MCRNLTRIGPFALTLEARHIDLMQPSKLAPLMVSTMAPFRLHPCRNTLHDQILQISKIGNKSISGTQTWDR